jgi:hypothetical protein
MFSGERSAAVVRCPKNLQCTPPEAPHSIPNNHIPQNTPWGQRGERKWTETIAMQCTGE